MALHSLIKINQFTQDPDLAWKKLEKETIKNEVAAMPLNTPIFPNKVRFVCISDTHSRHEEITNPIPNGDILIHAGDFTNGGLDEVETFSNFLKKLDDKFRYKVVIAGNNEVSFKTDPKKFDVTKYYSVLKSLNSNKTTNPRDKLKNCIYLEENSVQLFGINIFGSPWTPKFFDWAFTANRGEDILKHWDLIPNNTDVLITHGPPLGFGDIVENGSHVGCAELLSTVQCRVKPKFHIFGHIHRAYGCWSDGTTTFINASTCDYMRHPVNPPIIFDIDLPDGLNKESL